MTTNKRPRFIICDAIPEVKVVDHKKDDISKESSVNIANVAIDKAKTDTKDVVSVNVEETWSIFDIVTKACPVTWEKVFESAIDEIKTIDSILTEHSQGKTYYPRKKNIFRAFHLTPLDKVKVIIIGQDPYHQKLANDEPRATGLSFGVSPDDEIPVSLKNIYRELATSIKGFKSPYHGDLTKWAQQGVLMLNSCLTVDPGNAGSHGKIWLGFISKVLKAIQEKRPNVIVVMWGNEAKNIIKFLTNRAIKLTAAHPSGFSAYKGFFGCNHFNEINKYLKSWGEAEIDWQI